MRRTWHDETRVAKKLRMITRTEGDLCHGLEGRAFLAPIAIMNSLDAFHKDLRSA